MEWKRELQKAAREGNVVMGSRKVMSGLRGGGGKFVVLARDGAHYERLHHYARLAGVEIHEVERGHDLGATVRKPFRVSAVLVVK